MSRFDKIWYATMFILLGVIGGINLDHYFKANGETVAQFVTEYKATKEWIPLWKAMRQDEKEWLVYGEVAAVYNLAEEGSHAETCALALTTPQHIAQIAQAVDRTIANNATSIVPPYSLIVGLVNSCVDQLDQRDDEKPALPNQPTT